MAHHTRFAQIIGEAALRLWPDLLRDIQERLFEEAVGVARRCAINWRFIFMISIRARPILPGHCGGVGPVPRKLRTYQTS